MYTELDRRAFLQLTAKAAGILAVAGACGRGSPGAGIALDPSLPSPRPELRLPGEDYGFPSPMAYSPPAYSRMILTYDTLLWTDSAGQVVPWLASRFDRSPDGLTYTFHLRNNVRWHDGVPLTADDVVFSFDYFKAKRSILPTFLIAEPDFVASVTAPDPGVVQFQLDKPAVTWPASVAGGFPIFPRHVWSPIDDPTRAQEERFLVGTGPYRLESYSRGEGTYVYTANDDFFLGRPFVKRIELLRVGDELLALRNGDVDAAGPPASGAPVGSDVLRPFRNDEDYGIVKGPPDFPSALYWNLSKGGALADVRFRRACALAIDREDLAKRVTGGLGHPGNPGFLPPEHPYRVEVEQYAHDPGEANRLLDEAGYARRGGTGLREAPDGKPLRFKLLAIPALEAVVELVKAGLGRIGVELQVDPVNPLQIFIGQNDYEMAVLFYAGIAGDPDYMRDVYSSKVTRHFLTAKGYKDDELDELAERQLVTLDEAQRKSIVARMQQIVARDLPLLHLYYNTPFLVYRRGTFDQWSGRSIFNKHNLVTGLPSSGMAVRPVSEG
jgi:peptide/nickel transport system substrate-binding protein